MKINYEKSEVYVLGVEEIEKNRIAELLNCKVGELPITTYLGVPVSDCKTFQSTVETLSGENGEEIRCLAMRLGEIHFSPILLSSIPLYANWCVQAL